MAGSVVFFEMSEVNHRQLLALLTLSSTILRTKASSPPSHHSSLFLPPKFLHRLVGHFPLPNLCGSWRRVLARASCSDAWNGGLHRVASNSLGRADDAAKNQLRLFCSRRRTLLRSVGFISTIILAALSDTDRFQTR